MKVKILFIKLLFNSGLKNPESMWTNCKGPQTYVNSFQIYIFLVAFMHV